MGVKNLSIILDSPTNTYYAGSNVTGKVLLSLDKPKKVRGLKISFGGFAHVSWKKRISTKDREGKTHYKTVTYSSYEEYFSNKYYLIGNESGEIIIPVGSHEYSFNSTLPQTLPTSFEGDNCHVRYTVGAKLDIPWKVDQKAKILFQVYSPLDLNLNSSAKEPVKREKSKTFCCCWCRSGPLTLVVCLPHSGVVPGQEIPVTIEVDNASNIDVDAINIKIKQVTTIIAHSPKYETRTAKKDLVSKSLAGVETNGSKTFNETITFPSVPFLNLDACSIINVHFYLKIESCVNQICHQNLCETIPLMIGSVPVHNPNMGNYFSSFGRTGVGFNTIPDTGPINPGRDSGAALPPPPGFYPDTGFLRPHGGEEYKMPTPQHTGGFNPPYPIPHSQNFLQFPQPIYPGLKVDFPSPAASIIDLQPSAPPLDG